MVLEHLVVAKAARADKLEQATLDDILRYGAQELFAEQSNTPETAAAGQDDQAISDAQQQQQQQHDRDKEGSIPQNGKQQQQRLRIVWDDEALDRMLDRSQLKVQADEGAAEAGEEEEDDFSKAFKVRGSLARGDVWRRGGLSSSEVDKVESCQLICLFGGTSEHQGCCMPLGRRKELAGCL